MLKVSSRTFSHAALMLGSIALFACGGAPTSGSIEVTPAALVRNVHAYDVEGEGRERLEFETDRGLYTFDRVAAEGERLAFELRLDDALVYRLDITPEEGAIHYRFEASGTIEVGTVGEGAEDSLAPRFERVREHQEYVDLAQRARLDADLSTGEPFATQHQTVAGDCQGKFFRSLCQLHCLHCAAHPFNNDPWCLGHFLWCLNPLNSILLN